MTPRDILIALLVMMIWGFNFVAGKWGLSQVPPLLLMSLRFALVAAILLPFAALPRGKLRAIAVLSFTLGTLHFSTMFSGLARLDAGTTSIVVQSQVPFGAILAAVYYRDYLGWRRTAGMMISFIGIIVLVGGPYGGQDPVAVLLVIAAAFLWAMANIQIKELGGLSGFTLNAWLALFCTPQLLIASLLLEDGQWDALASADLRLPASLAYMVVAVTVGSYQLWYGLLHRYAVNQAIPFMLLVPVFATLSGVLVLDETLTWQIVAGGLLTVGGVAAIVLTRPRAG